jgi:hypothetical protein
MPDTVKIPFGEGFEDATAIEIPAGNEPIVSSVTLPDGNELKIEMQVRNLFRLLNKTDEKGASIYIFTLQVKSETISRPSVEPSAREAE